MNSKKILQEPDRSKWYIATALACFSIPVGYVLLIVFAVLDFKNRLKRNDAILYSGLALLVFSLTFLATFAITETLTDSPLLLSMVIPQAATGICLFIVYAVHTRYVRRLSRCLSLVQNDHITSLNELGAILGLRARQTKKCVLRLIKANHLEGASIDKAGEHILFTRSIWARQRFVCGSCGAELIVDFGHTLVCEYCGQALPVVRN